ncbi:mercuric reductase [Salinimicrobium sp. GXAS 041]|uniref:mercuric reductase n=1 Tax=Salinimicrobium sp. GXAS 041 TaxID=3400806 RepID=UPI003C747F66
MEYDAIIIGTGQAGPPLAMSLAKNGKKVAIIEKSHLGGTCVNTGCTPTKAYVASARRAYELQHSSELGVDIKGSVKVDLKKIKKRKDELVNSSRESWEKSFSEEENVQLFRGKAKFQDSKTVQVNEEVISGKSIYINVGASPFIPEVFQKVPFLTNESILELEEIPEHLMIVGGGYVGLEFAQMFRRFGSKVSIIERGDRLMKQEDPDISKAIAEILQKEEISILFNTDCTGAKEVDDGIELQLNEDQVLTGSHLLVATGRKPNTKDLGLEKTGVEIDEKGYIKVNDVLQTNVSHIYALGDCNGEGAFTHTSYNDFQIVNSQLFGDKKLKLSGRIPCYAAYIDPPLARVGLNETQIKEKRLKAKMAFLEMNKVARAKEMGETNGHLKIYIEEKNEKILGASFLGVRADEFIHLIIDSMYAGAKYEVIRDAVHIHPTVSELIPTMLQELKPME